MKLKENIKYFVIVGIIFFVVYVFVAARPLQDELILTPEWTITLSEDIDNTEAPAEGKTLLPFLLGKRLGYFTNDGNVYFSHTFPSRAAVSRSSWATYDVTAKDIPLYTPDGEKTGTIAVEGFPYLQDDRIYVALPGGTGIAACAPDGSELWRYEDISPIITFNSSAAGAVIGYADGKLVCLAPDGSERYSFYPGGSTYPVILGSDISASGNYTACVSGQDDQRFLVVKSAGDQYKIVFHEYLSGNLRRQAFVRFDSAEDFILYEYAEGLGIVDVRAKKSSKIPLNGRVVSFGESEKDGLYFVLSKENDGYRLSVVEKPDHLISSRTFPARNAFLIHDGDSLYLGCDDSIFCVTVSRG